MVFNDANEVRFRYMIDKPPTVYCPPSRLVPNAEPDWQRGKPFIPRHESIQDLTSFWQRTPLYGTMSLSWPRISETVATIRKMGKLLHRLGRQWRAG